MSVNCHISPIWSQSEVNQVYLDVTEVHFNHQITAVMLESANVLVLLSHVLSRCCNFCILMPIALADTSAPVTPLCVILLCLDPSFSSFLFLIRGFGIISLKVGKSLFSSLSLQIKSFW